jgi:hypothetical protein
MAELLGGLGMLGNFINSRNDKKTLDNKSKVMKVPSGKLNSANTIGKNIFDNNAVLKVNKDLQKLGKKKYMDANNYKKTGVIPRNYNYMKIAKKKININNEQNDSNDNTENFENNYDSDSRFTDETSDDISINTHKTSNASIGNMNNFDPSYFIDKADMLIDNRKHERKFVEKTVDRNNYLSQFDELKYDNPGNPVSQNAVPMNSSVHRIQAERELALNGGYSNFEEDDEFGNPADMTYGIVDKKHFKHNNMQPFFKSKGGTNPYMQKQLADVGQRKMEFFTGSDKRLDYKHKIEQKPLFSPLANMTNTFGQPVMTDFYESRYIPSKERRNEVLFQPVKVTPGLALGYNENATFGYVDPTRILPKTIDEIRPQNKQQKTHTFPVVPGQGIAKGAISVPVKKNKQKILFKENNPADMQKSYAYTGVDAPRVRENFDPKVIATVNRGLQEKKYVPPAQSNIQRNTPHEMIGQFKETSRQNFDQSKPANVHLVDGLMARPDHRTFVPKDTQRANELNYLGPNGRENSGKNQTMNYNDVPEPTLRNVHNEYDRAGQTTGSFTKNQTTNYNDVPDLNLRNVHNQSDRAGQTTGSFTKNQTINYNDVPDLNLRNVHNQSDRAGQTTGEFAKNKSINYNDVPDLNLRNVHNQSDRAGQTTGEFAKNKSINYNDVPDLNLRNVHNQSDRAGQTTGEFAKNKSINYNDVPDLNLRNVHNQSDRAGQTTGEFAKNKSINYNDVPDLNLRNVHNQSDRAGQTTGSFTKNQTINYNDVPNVTLRDVHNQYDRAGQTQGSSVKNQTINYNDVPNLNLRNVHNQSDRAGQTTGSFTKNQTINYDDIPDFTLRNVHNQYDRAGQIQGSSVKNQTIDYTDVPDVNLRNVHNQYDRAGQTQGNQQKSKTIDYTDVPDFTQRNTYNYNDYGPAQKSIQKNKITDYTDVPDFTQRNTYNYDDYGPAQTTVQKNKVIDYNDVPDVTQRETTGYTNRPGTSKSIYDATRLRNDVENMIINETKEKIEKGRKPTLVNVNKGHTIDFTEYEFPNNRGLPNERNNAPNFSTTINDRLNYTYTQQNIPRFFVNNDEAPKLVADTLDFNPLVNNIVYQALPTKRTNDFKIDNRLIQKGKIIMY